MNKKTNITIVILLLLFCLLGSQKSKVMAAEDGFTYVKKLGSGLNLGNTFETGMEDLMLDEHSTESIVNNIKSKGFTSIRIPITWQGHWDEETGVIEDEYLLKIQRLIDTAISKELYVVITMYDDSWQWIRSAADKEETKKQYRSLWKQIATYFKEYDERVCFEALNAPGFTKKTHKDQIALLNAYNNSFISTVRATGGKNKDRYLLVPILNGQVNEENCKAMSSFLGKLKDKKVIASVQYYGQWNFSVNAAAATSYNKAAREHMKKFFSLIDTHFTKKKIAVACVEYGLYGYPVYENAINRGERLKYFYDFTNNSVGHRMSFCLWDTGVLYNRAADTWVDETLFYIIREAGKQDYSYGSKDALYLVDGKEIKDTTICFALHNGTISYVRYKGKVMKDKDDYVIKDNTLTIFGSFLDSLPNVEYGLMGTIEVMFTKGPNWTIDIYRVGKPSLASSGSKEETWEIPLQEQGDMVASMEAFTNDKKPVGPLKWTTFQEYGFSFLPNYKKRTIGLSESFVASIPAGKEVTLRLHFRSGQALDYKIIKDDNGVRQIGYDWNTPEPTATPFASPTPTIVPTEMPDLGRLVEEENKKALERKEMEEQFAVSNQKEEEAIKRSTTGWKLLFLSFGIMFVLGVAVLYIYRTHRKEDLTSMMKQTDDHIEEKIHKILVDKSGKDA